jgi:hypothetical protein
MWSRCPAFALTSQLELNYQNKGPVIWGLSLKSPQFIEREELFKVILPVCLLKVSKWSNFIN